MGRYSINYLISQSSDNFFMDWLEDVNNNSLGYKKLLVSSQTKSTLFSGVCGIMEMCCFMLEVPVQFGFLNKLHYFEDI